MDEYALSIRVLTAVLFINDSPYKGINNHLTCDNSLIVSISIAKHSHDCIFKSISITNIAYIQI